MSFLKPKPDGYHEAYDNVVKSVKEMFPDFHDHAFLVVLAGVMVRIRKYSLDGCEMFSFEFALGTFYTERAWQEQFLAAYKDMITEEEAAAIAKVVIKGQTIEQDAISDYLYWCYEMTVVCQKFFKETVVPEMWGRYNANKPDKVWV